jgi:outer membrane protein assembly factor BamB
MSVLEWPMHRHNFNLTGRAPGIGDIVDPQIAGQLKVASGSTVELWVEDLNLDGEQEYVFATGGQIHVRNSVDGLLWRSEVCNPIIIGFHDLDGTGKEKCVVVIKNSRTLSILSGLTGEEYWSYTFERKTVMLMHNRMRVGAIHPELKGEQITVWAEGDEFGYLFSFELGVRHGRLVWKTKGIGMGDRSRYRPNVLIGDMQGLGYDSIIVIQFGIVWIVDPLNGEVLWQIDGPELRNYGVAGLYDVDGDGVMELIFVNDSVQLRVSVVKWEGDGFRYIWSNFIGYGDHTMKTPYWPVWDIDGDGRLEIMYSVGVLETNVWQVEIIDAATGAQKHIIQNARILDSGDMDGDGRRELLLEDVISSELVLVRPEGVGGERLNELFRTSHKVISYLEGNRPITSNHTNIPRGTTYLHDVDGDGAAELLMCDESGLDLYSYGWKGEAGFGEKRRVTLGENATVIHAFHQHADPNNPYQLLVRQDDRLRFYVDQAGVVAEFNDHSDVPTNLPLITDIDGDGIPEILLGDSVYVANQASGCAELLLSKKWSLQANAGHDHTFFHAFSGAEILAAWDFDQDGKKELLFGCVNAELIMTNSKGDILWRNYPRGVLRGGRVMDVTPGRFISPDRYDLFVNVASTLNSYNEGLLLKADTGDILWRRNDGHDGGMGPVEGYASVRQLEADGLDDLSFLSGDTVMAIDGATGRDLMKRISLGDLLGTRWLGYGQFTYVDVDQDGEDEVFLSAIWGLNGGVLKKDKEKNKWESVWFDYYGNMTPIGTPPRHSHQGIAIVNGKVLIAGPSADYKYVCVDALTGERRWMYELNNCLVGDTVTGDIDGDGHEEFIFGCNDGHLYAFKHDGQLLFKLFTETPPGSPVLADVNGDGKLEIVVTRSDGSLLVIMNNLTLIVEGDN